MKNRGKGQAVKLGVFCSVGKMIMFADADGAMPFNEFSKLEKTYKSSNAADLVVCGSRAHLETNSIARVANN